MEKPEGPSTVHLPIATMPPQSQRQRQQNPNTTPSPPSSPTATAAVEPAPLNPANQTSSSSDLSEEEKDSKPLNPQLEHFCRTMHAKWLRKYIVSQLSDTAKLREELPKALKLASKPAKLVFRCLGKFYVKASKSFDKDTKMVASREVCMLAMECLLLVGFDQGVFEIDKEVEEEAEQAALAWQKRLIDEGGVRNATKMDARGLLLLIGCFGIPRPFRNEDVRDLLRVSNIREISSALRRSNVLMEKIPEIIEGMAKHKMEVDAVDVVYTFGLQEKFSPSSILSAYLQEFKESLKRKKWASHGAIGVVNAANRKELSALKSVIECLEGHNVDPSKLIPRFRISDRIESLENKIAKSTQKTELCKRFKDREAKRSRFLGLEQQRFVNHINNQRTLLEGGTAGHIYGYSVPPVLHGPVAGSIPETVAGSLAGSMGGVAMGGVGPGITTGTNRVLQAGSRAGFHAGVMFYGTAGQIGSHNSQLYGRHWDASMYERRVPQNYAYGPSPPLPNTVPVSGQSSASNPHQFATTVPASAVYQNSGSHAAGAAPPVAHHSSYMYGGTYYPQGMP